MENFVNNIPEIWRVSKSMVFFKKENMSKIVIDPK